MPDFDRPLTSSSPASQWEAWVESWCAVLQQAPRQGVAGPAHSAGPLSALIFAPHPDDECIVGALPLRLRQEAGWSVANVAVTLGSRHERRAERLSELQAACEVLGFGLHLLSDDGFEQVKPEAAAARTPLWQAQVTQVATLLNEVRPALVLVPHAGDGIPTHMGVHALVSQALAQARLSTVVAWTEFWATQAAPNLLVETGVADTARLVRALSCHHGEIARNPYHLRLPAWMADNVRRGGELLAGPGETPPPFGFATLYRLSRWVDGQPQGDLPARMLSCEDALRTESLLAAPSDALALHPTPTTP